MTKTDKRMGWGGWARLAVALAAALAPLGCAGPVSRPSAPEARLPVDRTAVDEAGLYEAWHTEVGIEDGTRVAQFWPVGEKFLAIRTSDNRLCLLEAETGVKNWNQKTAAPHESVWPPAAHEGIVWVPTTTRLLGYDAGTGRVKREVSLDFAPNAGCATDGVHVFVPDGRGWMHAVAVRDDAVSWGLYTQEPVTSRPVLGPEWLFFGNQAGELFAAPANSQALAWEFRAEAGIVADLKLSPLGTLLVASRDYSVYAFQGSSGRLLWRLFASEPVLEPAWPLAGRVYVFTNEAGVRCVDEASGQVQWTVEQGASFVSGDDETTYVRGRSGGVLAIRAADGAVRHTLPVAGGTMAAPNNSGNGMIYLATPDGMVMALRKKAAGEQ